MSIEFVLLTERAALLRIECEMNAWKARVSATDNPNLVREAEDALFDLARQAESIYKSLQSIQF